MSGFEVRKGLVERWAVTVVEMVASIETADRSFAGQGETGEGVGPCATEGLVLESAE